MNRVVILPFFKTHWLYSHVCKVYLWPNCVSISVSIIRLLYRVAHTTRLACLTWTNSRWSLERSQREVLIRFQMADLIKAGRLLPKVFTFTVSHLLTAEFPLCSISSPSSPSLLSVLKIYHQHKPVSALFTDLSGFLKHSPVFCVFCLFLLNWPIWRETHLNHVWFLVTFLKFSDNSPDRWMETERGESIYSRGGIKKQRVRVKVRESIRGRSKSKMRER